MRGLGEIFYLFKRRRDGPLLPSRKLWKAMHESVSLQTRALSSPRQEFWFDVNANHAIKLPSTILNILACSFSTLDTLLDNLNFIISQVVKFVNEAINLATDSRCVLFAIIQLRADNEANFLTDLRAPSRGADSYD